MANSIIKPHIYIKRWEVDMGAGTTYYKELTRNIAVDGMTPIGVIGHWSEVALMNIYRLYVSGNVLHVGVAEPRGLTPSDFGSVLAYVLYM